MLQVTFAIKLISQYSFENCVICVIFVGKGFGVVVESIFERLCLCIRVGLKLFFLVNCIWRQTFPT